MAAVASNACDELLRSESIGGGFFARQLPGRVTHNLVTPTGTHGHRAGSQEGGPLFVQGDSFMDTPLISNDPVTFFSTGGRIRNCESRRLSYLLTEQSVTRLTEIGGRSVENYK